MNQDSIFDVNEYFLNDLGLNKINFIKDEMQIGKVLIKTNDDNFYIYNDYETIIAKKEDYLIDFLKKDIMNFQSYLLRILLFRNESFL